MNLTYVDNNTPLTTPPGPEEQTVNLTLISARDKNLSYEMPTLLIQQFVDSDGDGYLDNTDDCLVCSEIPQTTELVV